MFNFFPFTDGHQLNLDWILIQLKKMPLTVNNTVPDENRNINLPTVAGMSSWNGIGADGAGNVNPIEDISDLDDAAVGLHIYRWENPDTDNNPYGAPENTGYMDGLGGGICISGVTSNRYGIQIAFNNGCTAYAIRQLSSGFPWTSWKYMDPTIKDVSSNITLGIPSCINQLESYQTTALIRNGHASVYIEGKTIAAAGLNDLIASGLPIPSNPGSGIGYITGMILDSATSTPKPCRFLIDGNGDLSFSYLGNAENAGDVLIIRGEYPIDQ